MAWLLIGLASYTLIQVIPLPAGVVAALSPASAEIWGGALRPFGETAPSFITLSVDPAGTTLEVLKWFGYACVVVATAGWRERRGSAPIALLVFGAASAVYLVTVIHGIFDLPRIYGMYRPVDPSRWLRGPFVNGNNLAGYLNLGIFAGVGLWLSTQTLPRWPFALGIPLLTSGVLLSESRAGIAALVCAAVFVAVAALRLREAVPARVVAGVATAFGIGLIAALLSGGARLWNTFADVDTRAKISAWRWTLDLVRDFPVVGVGRGAFEPAFLPYRKLLGRDFTMVFPYTENFPLQWIADWGPAVGIAALALFVWFVRYEFRSSVDETLTTGIAAGIGALLLQNLWDLGLEIFAVSALALAALMALSRSKRTEPTGRSRVRFVAAGGAIVAVLAVITLGAEPVRHERDRISKAYASWVRGGSREPKAFLQEIHACILRHPGEAYFPLIGSIVASQIGDDPVKWIGRALERSPLDGHAHLRLADVMAARGSKAQALLHLRLAAVYDGILRDTALAKAAVLVTTRSELARAFPADVPGGSLLSEMCKKLGGSVRIDCWSEVADREAGASGADRELADALLDALETASPPCGDAAATACRTHLDRVLAAVEALPSDWHGKLLRARALALAGDHRRAASLLVDQCPASDEGASCCEYALAFARNSSDLALLGRAADRYASLSCTEARRCATAHDRIARDFTALGALTIAHRHYALAATEDPSIERWLKSAEAAARAGSPTNVHVAFERARREGELTSEQLARMAAIEASLASVNSNR